MPMFKTLVRVQTCAVMVIAGMPVGAAEKALLLRTFPTDVSWGEISIAEGPPIELPGLEDRVAFPFRLTIVCNQRERREDVSDAAGRAVLTPPRRRGAVYLAAQLEGGRDAWKDVIDKLRERVDGLTPETFGTFAQTFGNQLIGREPVLTGAFRGFMCISVDGQSDEAREAKRTVDKDGVGTSSHSFNEPGPVCAKLVGALEGEAPLDTLASRFEVRAQREESLTVQEIQATSDAHATWPEGAGVEYAEPPKGATAYTSTGSSLDDAVWYEEIRPARRAGPPQTQKPYLLKAKTRKSTIPKQALDSDTVLARWTWRVRDVSLGTEPKISDHEVATLDTAFLFTAAHGRIENEEFERTVARDFASSSEKPGVALLDRLITSHARELGVDEMYFVNCDPSRPGDARYCVASACSKIANAEEFCAALASRLDSASTK